MLFDLTLSRHLNSTHHPSRSPFILCFISSSSHTSYTLYNHFFNPNICPLSCLLNNRIRACSCTSSPLYLTIGISTLICFNNSSADDCFTSAYRHVLFLLKLFHPIQRLSIPIKGCFYIRICS